MVRAMFPVGRQHPRPDGSGDDHAEQPRHRQRARGRTCGTRLLDFPAMSSRSRSFAALVAMSMFAIGVAVQPANAAGPPTPPTTVDSWAWCGVNPDDPVAAD